MTNLLLPYAYDSNGKLVHIDNSLKGQKYTCPNCGDELILRISKIPKGSKYHRRSHFAHKSNCDNNCSESFLHKLFKEKCAEYIRDKITKQANLFFEWKCEQCGEDHKGNLLKKAVNVLVECDLGVCKPDIALIDSNGKIVIAIEVIVTHQPETAVMKYYNDNKIACLQIKIEDFLDCEHIEAKLSKPYRVNLCPNPICAKCGHVMRKVKIVIVSTNCYKCSKRVKLALPVASVSQELLMLDYCYKTDLEKARKLGANIQKRYKSNELCNYLINECEYCHAVFGGIHMFDYLALPHEQEIELGYRCSYCVNETKRLALQEEMDASRARNELLMDLRRYEGTKWCPNCGSILRIRTSNKGLFWGCGGFPKCRYTEEVDKIRINQSGNNHLESCYNHDNDA